MTDISAITAAMLRATSQGSIDEPTTADEQEALNAKKCAAFVRLHKLVTVWFESEFETGALSLIEAIRCLGAMAALASFTSHSSPNEQVLTYHETIRVGKEILIELIAHAAKDPSS